MGFQASVGLAKSLGVAGDIYNNSPIRAQSFILNSGTQDNVVGYAYTINSEGNATVGGSGVFGGILVNSKEYALFGTAAGTLTPTLVLPEDSQGDLLTMGSIIVEVSNTGSIGDGVYFDDTTGALAIGTASTGQTQVPNAVVDYYDVSAAGLAVITLTN